MTTAAARAEHRVSPVFLTLVAIMGVSAWAVWTDAEVFAPFGLLALFGVMGGAPEAGRAFSRTADSILEALGPSQLETFYGAFHGLGYVRFGPGEPQPPISR